MSGLRRALSGLAVAGLAFGLLAGALVVASDHRTDPVPFLVLGLAMGWSFIGTGLYAWWRRPDNRIGPLMTLVGFAWYAGALSFSDAPLIYTIGALFDALWLGAFIQMLVAYPSGRIDSGLERRLVRLGWAVSVVPALAVLVTPRLESDCPQCPENVLVVWDDEDVANSLEVLFAIGLTVLLVGVCVLLVRRWREAGRVQRRALAPVLWTGAACAALGVVSLIPDALGAAGVARVVDYALIVLISAVPFAFLVGLLRSSLSRAGAVSALVERLGGISARDALAEALGDDTLALAYWLPERGFFVDAEGRRVELPAPGGGRGVSEIERDGERMAAVIHNASLLDDPELVRAAGAAAALALENERLDAELRARYDELRASRARLVAAGDGARRRLERDLHDGAQQRFVALAVALRLARNSVDAGSSAAALLDGAMAELSAGLAELRELARGIHPAVLSERGLEPALNSLVARSPVPAQLTSTLTGRVPPAVETAAYFVVAEALTNVAKYARASAAEVMLEHADGRLVLEVRDDGKGGADPEAGSGLAGIADRVAALDGRLFIHSPPGAGTVLRAEFPAPLSAADGYGHERVLGQPAAGAR
jgi:signal transduction histidine kinase